MKITNSPAEYFPIMHYFRSVFGDDIPCANLGNQGRVFVLRKAQNGNLRGIGGEWTRTIGYLIVGFE